VVNEVYLDKLPPPLPARRLSTSHSVIALLLHPPKPNFT